MMSKGETDLNNMELLLMQRSKQADQLIEELKSQIEELKNTVPQYSSISADPLAQENELLKQEIINWKKKLILAEINCGIRQFPSPTSVPSKPVTEAASSTAATKDSAVTKDAGSPPKETKQAKAEAKGKGESKKAAKEDKKPKGEPKKGKGEAEEGPVDVSRLNFKVGKILSAKRHPDADTLYVEDVDVGEEKTRTVVSGLVKFVPLEEMQNRMVVLLCNLKPAKMRGVLSEAMVMCASSPEKVEILIPPAGCVPGDVVEVEGYPRNPDGVLNPKRKIFETVAPDLRVNESKLATYKGLALSVPGKGNVVSPSLINVAIK